MRGVSMLLAIALVAIVLPASASPTARLVYSRSSDAESCPDEPALRHAVAARIGYDPFFAWATRTVVASLTHRDGAFVASVDLVDERGIAHGVRELRSSAGCGELLDAVALTIAIAIDPQSLAPTPPPPPPVPPAPPPSPPAPSEPEVATPLSRETPIAPRPSTPRAMTVEASAGGVASVGVAPGPAALGLSLGVDLRWRAFSLGVEGLLDAPAGKAAQGGGDVSSWLAIGALVPCAYFGPLLACAVAQGWLDAILRQRRTGHAFSSGRVVGRRRPRGRPRAPGGRPAGSPPDRCRRRPEARDPGARRRRGVDRPGRRGLPGGRRASSSAAQRREGGRPWQATT